MTTREAQQAVIEQYIAAYNAFNTDGMVRDMHDDVVFENVSQGTVDTRTEGKDQFKKQADTATQYFTERQQTITAWDFHGDTVVVTIQYKGVLAIDLPNGMKAGDTLELHGQSEFSFNNGKIAVLRDRSE